MSDMTVSKELPLPTTKETTNNPGERFKRLRKLTAKKLAAIGVAATLVGGVSTAVAINALENNQQTSSAEQNNTNKGGYIEVLNLGDQKDPFYIMYAMNIKVESITENKDGSLDLRVGLSGGNLLSKQAVMESVDEGPAKISGDLYSGKNTKIDFTISKNTVMADTTWMANYLGQGPDYFLEHIEVGDNIPSLESELTYQAGSSNLSDAQISQNQVFLKQLDAKVGTTETGIVAKFNASVVSINAQNSSTTP